jgi:hypothetical protein
MASSRLAQASNQEGKILLAIQAYKRGQISSIKKASTLYSVPFTILYDRLNSSITRENAQLQNRKLFLTEELTLVQWILSMDERGKSPRIATVREMANILLANRDTTTSSPTVGEKWVNRFINRHTELQSKFSRKYDYKRALCEDPKVIREWFDLVRNTIKKYGILLEDIYNFDKIKFLIGVITTMRVITGSEKSLRPKLIQPGNRE